MSISQKEKFSQNYLTSHKKCGIIITEGKGKTPTDKPNLSVANYLSVGEMENTMATFKTEREFLTAIVKGDFGTEFTDFAKARIAALDKKNAQRKVSKSALAHKTENDNFRSAILAVLVADKSTQKVSALARQLVKTGAVTVCDVPVKGKGKVKGYTLAAPESIDPVKDEPAETSAE